jgi:hypothetical protein
MMLQSAQALVNTRKGVIKRAAGFDGDYREFESKPPSAFLLAGLGLQSLNIFIAHLEVGLKLLGVR